MDILHIKVPKWLSYDALLLNFQSALFSRAYVIWSDRLFSTKYALANVTIFRAMDARVTRKARYVREKGATLKFRSPEIINFLLIFLNQTVAGS